MSDRDIVGTFSNEPSISGQFEPDIIIKGSMEARFPANVYVISPIQLDRTGGNYTFSLDLNEVIANLPPSGVASVFGRTGDVVAQSGDYTFAQIGSTPTTLSGYGITDAQPLDSDLTAIAALTTTSFGRGYLTLADASASRTYLALVPGTDIQAYDSDLAALAANSTNGLWARTGSGTGSARTITGPAAGITVTNGDGVSGNPTLALANDLAALEGLATTGLIARTATDTATTRTITGTANEISIANGDGVSGNPTASLPSSLTFTGKTITGGAFTGGTINNATVGATTAATVRGTTITSTDTTDSSSTSTGAIVTAGGLGVAKAASVGTTIGIGGAAVSYAAINFSGTITNTGGSAFVQRSAATVAPANGSIGYGGYFGMAVDTGASNVLSYSVGGYFPPLTKTGTGSITKVYGIYCDPQTIASTNNYSAYFGGNVTIGSETGAGRLSIAGGKLQLAAATSSYPAVNIPVGGPPSSPADGDIWLESNTNTGLKIRINGVTKTVTLT